MKSCLLTPRVKNVLMIGLSFSLISDLGPCPSLIGVID